MLNPGCTTRIPAYNIVPKKSVYNVRDVITILDIDYKKNRFYLSYMTSVVKKPDVKSLIGNSKMKEKQEALYFLKSSRSEIWPKLSLPLLF